ncbi:MAG: hypothetical protein HDR35_01785 [Treponema sp.]|nr:hypothetical protein [Treponema sp.]
MKRKGFFEIISIFLCAAFVFCMSSCLVVDNSTDDSGKGSNVEGQNPGGGTEDESGNSESPSTGNGENGDTTQKRGFGYNNLSKAQVNALSQGEKVTWAYNWAITPGSPNSIGAGEVAYIPMIWGGSFDETGLRAYLDANKGKVKCLLGFNEPNMGGAEGGCYMLPKTAAELWPKLEKIAEDYDLYLISPAMTYSGATLSDGKNYGTPESWLDEFIIEYKKRNDGKAPRMDYIALHSYMMWAGSVNEGYADKYAKMYGRKIFMTEFCSWWDNEGKDNSEAVQVQEMAQKIEAMDQNPNVAAYAWFMADGDYNKRPWNCLFKGKKSSQLSLAGKVYAYLGNTKGKRFNAGETIPVYEYTTSSNYNRAKGGNGYDNRWKAISENDDEQSKKDVQFVLTFQKGNYANYAVNVETAGEYKITVRSKVGSGAWQNRETTAAFKAGAQTLKYTADEEHAVAWIKFEKK